MSVSCGTKPLIWALVFTILMVAPSAAVAGDTIFELRFKEIGETYPGSGLRGIYELTNAGGRDIDDIDISISLSRADGEFLAASGVFQDMTPGLVWLRAGESMEFGVPLDRSPDTLEVLRRNPLEAQVVLTIDNITYME